MPGPRHPFTVHRRLVLARRIPVLTVTAVGIALAAAIVQYTVPAAIPALQRTSHGLAGQWWRLVTPLFVQTLGWYQVVTNLVTLALVGAVAEWHLGRWRWAGLFLAGTVGGQLAAFAWHIDGGGDSIAICGLAGGLLLWWADERLVVHRWELGIVFCYIAALTGWGLSGPRAAGLVAVAAAIAVRFVPGRRVLLIGALAGVTLLMHAADLHGASLAAGMLGAAPTIRRLWRPHDPVVAA